jgi:Trk-type K+ transport system membrane component
VALSARTSTIDRLKSGTEGEAEEDGIVFHLRGQSDNPAVASKHEIRYQAKNLIFRDVSYLIIGLMIISIAEDEKLVCQVGTDSCQCTYSQFKVLFELVSAYGTGTL